MARAVAMGFIVGERMAIMRQLSDLSGPSLFGSQGSNRID
jgi:hypothetical protein